MSRRRGWWYHTRDIVRDHPVLRERLRDLRTPSAPREGPGGGGPGRSTEQLALRTLPPAAQREHDAVEEAIRRTGAKPDGAERLRIIELVYWKGSHTMTGAAAEAHVSVSTAKRWRREFFLLVAVRCGYLDEEGTG